MAQHISILNTKLIELKGFQKVFSSLDKQAKLGVAAVSGSLRFEELLIDENKINKYDRVFVTTRVVNGRKELFELHYDTREKRLLDVFLVS